MSQIQSLIREAKTLATQINNDRLCGLVPTDEVTIRLVEVVMIMEDLRNEENPECLENDDTDDGIQCYINGKPVTSEEFVQSYS